MFRMYMYSVLAEIDSIFKFSLVHSLYRFLTIGILKRRRKYEKKYSTEGLKNYKHCKTLDGYTGISQKWEGYV